MGAVIYKFEYWRQTSPTGIFICIIIKDPIRVTWIDNFHFWILTPFTKKFKVERMDTEVKQLEWKSLIVYCKIK